MYIKVAFLLTNLVSDLVNPDCSNVHVSWNKNLKKDRVTMTRGQGITIFKTKMAGFRRAPLAIFSLEELLHDPGEVVHDNNS